MTVHRSSRIQSLILVLTLAVSLTPLAPSPAEAASDKPTLLGWVEKAEWRQGLDDFEEEAGKYPAFFQLFWDLEIDDGAGWEGQDNAWAQGMLTDLEGRGITAYVEVWTDDLDALNSGAKNGDLEALAKAVGEWLKEDSNRKILIAPLPEMNLKHAGWGADPDGFKDGYRRIRDAFLTEGLGSDQIRFVFAPNGTSDFGEYEDYYPGDSIVDVIGFAKINRGDPWRDYQVTFQEHIDELRSRVSLAKPILITQTGSVDVGGDKAKWLNDMFTGLKAHDQVIGATYFNRDKDHDYRVLKDGDVLDPAFDDGYQTWSGPGEVDWIFDGRMDAWVAERIEAYGSGFTDIAGHIFANSIIWLAVEQITAGCNPPDNTEFCPDDTVTRGQMAVFIARAEGLPAPSGDHFTDDRGAFYESAANRLYEAGITNGCGEDRYCGGEQMNRGQMAAFLARIADLPATSTDHFGDDDGSTFEDAINKIAEAKVTLGCNPPTNDRFCPDDPVTRGQMATFLKRALGS